MYICEFSADSADGINVTFSSKVRRRSDNKAIDHVTTTINIQSTNDWIADSNSIAAISSAWDWKKLIDQTKRAHLDYFSQRAQIDDYYPMNSETFPDISSMYT